MQTFEGILGNATTIDTGFIVLEHDLFEITVDLARGYTIPAALSHQPAFDLKPIGACQGWPKTDLYLETTTNTTFPFQNSTVSTTGTPGTNSSDGTGTRNSDSKGSGSSSASQAQSTSGALPAISQTITLSLLFTLSLAIVGASAF
jgi:hypothetical protein